MSRPGRAVRVRDGAAADAAACAAIYAPFVTGTAVTFETEPPGPEEMARRIVTAQERHAWLVAETVAETVPGGVPGAVVGYAYAGAYRPRAAYARTAETSIYVAPEAGGQGVGRQLYAALLDRLRELGYGTAVAGLTPPNPGSERLHEALGFTLVGRFTRVGRKFGSWQGCDWWELALSDDVAEP